MSVRFPAPALLLPALTLSAFVGVAAPAAALDPPIPTAFKVEQRSDRLIITDFGRPVAEYVFNDSEVKRPYLCRVRTPSGIQVTRNHPPVEGKDLADHPTFHPGVWFAFGDINGVDFWRNKGTIRHESVEHLLVLDMILMIEHECTLIADDGRKLGKAQFRLGIGRHKLGYVIGYDATIHAGNERLVLGDQEEMGLGVRVATPLAEKNGGRVTSREGRTGAKTVWGTQALWCDYSGTIDGRKVGVTVVAHPQDSRPTWWHVRDYGLMVANAFGKRSLTETDGDPRVIVEPDHPLRLPYVVVAHDADDYDPKQAAALQGGKD
jgi:hypothetical protein